MHLIKRTPQAHQLSEFSPFINDLLSARGIIENADLSFELKDLVPISQLKGLDQAVDLLCNALEQQRRILIVGDFDADGATATSVSKRALQMMGFQQVDYIVPNRFEYGYGLTPEIIDAVKHDLPDIILTVDNGISSYDGVEYANQLGCQVLITDHHLAPEVLPNAAAILNPNQPNDSFPSKALAGVGVVFYLMLALKFRLQQNGYFSEQGLAPPNLTTLLDLVALGTVADVVPLDKNNRILVEQGLRRIRSGHCCMGIQALFAAAKRDLHEATSADLAFACAPRLNAAGRLDDMSLGIECLLSNDWQQASQLAAELDQLNRERRAIETTMKDEAIAELEQLLADDMQLDTADIPAVICLYREDWHQGVVGIVASRIREKYHRPVLAFAPASATEIKGSGRSIPGIHMRDVLDAVATQNPGLVSRFGGHAMAAGLSLHPDKFTDFQQAICDTVLQQYEADVFQEAIYTDGAIPAVALNLDTAETLRTLAPWGQHFPAPVFDDVFTVIHKRVLKEQHIKLQLRTHEQHPVDAICFFADIVAWEQIEAGEEIHVLYRLEVNTFRGERNLQLLIERLL